MGLSRVPKGTPGGVTTFPRVETRGCITILLRSNNRNLILFVTPG